VPLLAEHVVRQVAADYAFPSAPKDQRAGTVFVFADEDAATARPSFVHLDRRRADEFENAPDTTKVDAASGSSGFVAGDKGRAAQGDLRVFFLAVSNARIDASAAAGSHVVPHRCFVLESHERVSGRVDASAFP
jgi:hypothetical protein